MQGWVRAGLRHPPFSPPILAGQLNLGSKLADARNFA